ncbi:RNA polymerase factor sigma-54 [Weizmannia acidilactici]|uniref:RNA polymerase factor sigma-54 n=1 Tax=Weizmannia acidilactici TaxID=2607726 RepID=UPI00124CEC1B|nr:RNA polymerase factor sigma-54 [Weizmannia acidilactici]GER65936.1 RNA polymerase sigma-54 factor [Weizmannia acidilactici]GER74392.1 RNA polymerase sigma-54 factor [Weizmannia acidilactici]
MDLQVGLWQKQSMKLAMTQELKQAIEVLQFSSQELMSFLEEKTAENPLIELYNTHIKLVDSRFSGLYRMKGQKKSQEKNWIEQIPEQIETLPDYLISQLNMKSLPKTVAEAVKVYAGHLDANGYLAITAPEAAQIAQIPVEDAEKGLEILQTLDPAGIGARSLQECLLIQIKRDPDAPTHAAELIGSHFLEFAEKKWKGIAKKMDISMQEIQQAADYIQTLNPRPGAGFSHETPQYIVPDLMVKNSGGELELFLVEGQVPRVRFNEDYSSMLKLSGDAQAVRYLKEKTQEYHWIQKSIESRKETLLKVGKALLEKQRDFFLYGKGHLKPLTMKEVSDAIGMHESTVSRAVREKYIETPFGTFPLKQFFTTALPVRSGTREEAASSAEIKNQIATLVNREDKRKPLSDQTIVTLLNKKGFEISRRTVAKYREQLGIPSSAKRKRYE